jgi:hypothetical protein
MIDLATNLNTGVGSGQSREPELKCQIKIREPSTSPHEPSILVECFARRNLAHDAPMLDTPILFISLPALQTLTIKDRFRLVASPNQAPSP